MRGLSVIHTASSNTDQLPFRLFSLLSLALLFHFRFQKGHFLFFFSSLFSQASAKVRFVR